MCAQPHLSPARGEPRLQVCMVCTHVPNSETAEHTSTWALRLPRDTPTPSFPAPGLRPSIYLPLLSLEGVEVGGQGQGTRQINMALVFPEARAGLMMGLIERRSVKRILIDLTSLIRICVWKGPPLGPRADKMLTAEVCLRVGITATAPANSRLI